MDIKDIKNYQEALEYHSNPCPGKLSVSVSKDVNQDTLSLAYTPGVAAPCLEIYKSPEKVYNYTNKGNTVGIITNGSAVLGLGNIGVLASKPVMEGKAILLKKFVNIDAFDVLVDTQDVNDFISTVSNISLTFGAINLEDIKAPDCFIIEEKLQEKVNIPIFHDDQHGTAVVLAAAMLNALEIQNKKIENVKIVINGAGAAGIACANLLLDLGVALDQIFLCDSLGLINSGRRKNMNIWKEKFMQEGEGIFSLKDVLKGADIFVGLSVGNIFDKEMVMNMNRNSSIFAMANPIPEVNPNFVNSLRKDMIVATGRSDYLNQVNNLLAFPYILKSALDTRVPRITTQMKITASKSIAKIAKSYSDFGKKYILPNPFDSSLMGLVRDISDAAFQEKIINKKI